MTFSDGDLGHIAVHNALVTTEAARGVYADWTPTLTNFPGTVAWARYAQIGKLVFFNFACALTGAATGTMGVSLPVLANTTYTGASIGTASVFGPSSNFVGFVVMAGGTPSVMNFYGAGGVGSGGVWAATVPVTWASGSGIRAEGFYEAA